MRRTLAACCAAHFLVDFACAFLVFRFLGRSGELSALLLAYNFCAFAVQMPLGLLADRWDRDGTLAAAGVLTVAMAYALTAFPWLAALAAGLGNAAFHVGAGLETLSVSRKKAGPLGLFVSPGAVGLFCGTVLGKGGAFPAWIAVILLLLAAAALLLTKTPRPVAETSPELPPFRTVGLPLLALLGVVILRSWVGMGLTFPWKGEGHWAAVLVLALAAGKAAGGYLADRFGFRKTAAVSLALSAVLLLLAPVHPMAGTAAIFLFNMTMPLTLWASARQLPSFRGFAFGLLTFGLFMGFLPAAFGVGLSAPMAAAGALASLALLLPGLGKAVGK
ncbi:hypothetical protein JQM68_06320 [Oscillibacter valericigenes]|uniref:hypothetical protein n=1 Tax=Oscillibacter valericigenes TaxID=351091 RepID=UPI001F40C3F0|nr:hypothetical protein [Oscillibacter valericigenes]MCF2616807.1 hypothetical protein [Oscillibacter valericigenes]